MQYYSVLNPTFAKYVKPINNKFIQDKYVACMPFPYVIDNTSISQLLLNLSYDDELEQSLNMPLLYIVLSEKVYNDNLLFTFVTSVLTHSSLWNVGIDGFRPGENYFVNHVLAERLANEGITFSVGHVLDNILDTQNKISDAWNITSNEDVDAIMLQLSKSNDILDLHYSEDELKNFYSTFCREILRLTSISDEQLLLDNNPVFAAVLKYFKQMMIDEASVNIGLMLGSKYSFNDASTNTCGCQTKTTSTTLEQSCADKYKTAMTTWLKEMLGSVDFYKDWFREPNNTINEALVDALVLLINEFLSLNLDLTLNDTTDYNACPTINVDQSRCNKEIINRYLEVLTYVKDNQIDENKNKISTYGKAFGELLPKLQF